MLMKLVFNVATMKFHQKVYTLSLFQQLPYFEQSNRRSYTLNVFEGATNFSGNQLFLLYDGVTKMASIFSLDGPQRQVVPFHEAVLGDESLIKAIPTRAQSASILLLTTTQLVLHQTQVQDMAGKFRTLYLAKEGELLLDIMMSDHLTILTS